MTTDPTIASIIQLSLAISADIPSTEILQLAEDRLDVAFHAENFSNPERTIILGLCPDSSILFIVVQEASEEENRWSTISFPSLSNFADFLQSPTHDLPEAQQIHDSIPKPVCDKLQSLSHKYALASALEPGHA